MGMSMLRKNWEWEKRLWWSQLHRLLQLNLLLHPKKKNHHNLRRKGPLSPRRKRFYNPRRKRLRNLKRKKLLNLIIRKYPRKQFLALEKWKQTLKLWRFGAREAAQVFYLWRPAASCLAGKWWWKKELPSS